MEDYSQPILPGTAATDYERYLRTDDLLALQKRPEDMVHRDELLFQTVHQSSELWLKLAAFEVESATDLIRRNDLPAAIRLLRRALDCIEFITGQLHMLEHMSPWEYQTIRKVLGHGSGFDSPGFKHIQAVSPDLGQAFNAQLEARRLSVVDLYLQGRTFEELYQIAELLIGWDERVLLWKFHHFQVVQRIIGGHVIGTQGTPVEVLGKRIGHRLFPALWDARDELTMLAKQPGSQASPTPGHGM